MGDVTLRIPALENLATQYGDFMSSGQRALTQSEKNTARAVFQSSINLDIVQIVKTGIVNAPTTLGNNIRVSPGYTMSDAILIHELTHIWQYQTQGNRYVSDSLCRQLYATAVHGDRNAAYIVTIVPGQSFYRYSTEVQAMIVQYYFSDRRKQNNRDYARMIGEVRSARPSISKTQRYLESLYGQRNWQQEEQIRQLIPDYVPQDRIAPIIRLEVRW